MKFTDQLFIEFQDKREMCTIILCGVRGLSEPSSEEKKLVEPTSRNIILLVVHYQISYTDVLSPSSFVSKLGFVNIRKFVKESKNCLVKTWSIFAICTGQ